MATTLRRRRYDWRPDKPDFRDFTLPRALTAAALPAAADLRPSDTAIKNQYKIGSCTGNAIAGLRAFLAKAAGVSFDPSRLYLYNKERIIEGDFNQDGGAEIRDGMKVIGTVGVCSEKEFAYTSANLFKKPTAKMDKDAAAAKVKQYTRLTGLADMKTTLAAGFPVVFGFTVYTSFESAAVAKTGLMPVPTKDEKVLGGHAVMAIGYDDAKQMLIVRNSWGTAWGDKGYFYMPYAYMHLCSDFWTARI